MYAYLIETKARAEMSGLKPVKWRLPRYYLEAVHGASFLRDGYKNKSVLLGLPIEEVGNDQLPELVCETTTVRRKLEG